MKATDVIYILRGEKTFSSLPEAERGLEQLINHVGWNPGIMISYQMKKKRFKRWVPTWLRYLLTE